MELKVQIDEADLEPVVERIVMKLFAERNSAPRPEEELTAKQVAEIKKVEPRTVREWARHGRLRSHRTPTGQLRFYRKDVDAPLVAV